MPLTEKALEFVAQLIASSVSGAGCAYIIFQFLGKKWIESKIETKFAKELADHKHNQNVDLQRRQVEIDSLLSGSLKLQEREFELLPDAWEKLDEAYGLVRSAMSPGQISVNIGGMTDDRLEEYLEKSAFLETQKEELRSSSNRD